MLIEIYVVRGHTTCYDEIARTEIEVHCDQPQAQPTVQLRCILQFKHLQQMGDPFWICAHYQDNALNERTYFWIEQSLYVYVDKTRCSSLPVPREACVTTTTPCLYQPHTEVNPSPSGFGEFYQVPKDATAEEREVTAYDTNGDGGWNNGRKAAWRLKAGEQITLLGLNSDGTVCTISFHDDALEVTLQAEIPSKEFKIESISD